MSATGVHETGVVTYTTTTTKTGLPTTLLDLTQSRTRNFSYQLTETGGANSASLVVQISNDGINWTDIQTLAASLQVEGAGNALTINNGGTLMLMGPVAVGICAKYVRLALSDAVSGNHANVTINGIAQ